MSPEFAYTEEKWASLRDNVMEYGELKDLIHEYNPTVRSNRSAYKDQKGKDLNDVYEQYMNDIDDIIISSVVPPLVIPISKMCERYFKIKPLTCRSWYKNWHSL